MTKKQLQEENKRLRETLERIVSMTTEEGVKKMRKDLESDGMEQYACAGIVGMVRSQARYGLYGEDFLLHPDKCKEMEGGCAISHKKNDER